MSSCFFIGHRDAPEELYPAIREAVERYIVELGVREFVVGHYGMFDNLSARAVKAAKLELPAVRLYLLLPYHPSYRPIETPSGFDGTFYPPGMEVVPQRYAIPRANRYMIDHSDFLISYVRHPGSNARDLVEYAQRREKRGLIAVTML